MLKWIKVPIDEDLLLKMNEFNYKFPEKKIKLKNVVNEALTKKLDEVAKNMGYCKGCRKLKHIRDFDNSGYQYCKLCTDKILNSNVDLKDIRKKIVDRYNGKCVICGAEYKALHHIVPQSEGGSNYEGNLIPLCSDCHYKAHNGAYSNWFGVNEDMYLKFKQIVDENTTL